MHELSLCRALIEQVGRLAAQHHAHSVSRIRLRIGPLAGVEIDLMHSAFPHSSRGSLAENALLEIEQTPLRVRCEDCGTVSEVSLNQLRCRHCGDWRTQLIGGDELLLQDVDFLTAPPASEEPQHVP